MALYDFLYQNDRLIRSIYAQRFDGIIKGTESRTKTGEKSTGAMEGGVRQFVMGKHEHAEEHVNESVVHTDPHDTLVLDTLAYLSELFQPDHTKAQNGQIIAATGVMHLVNKAMLEMVSDNAGTFFASFFPGNKKERNEQQKVFTMIRNFLASLTIDPLVYLQTPDGLLVGTIKESCHAETISGFQLKHGMTGLSNATLIGIKESGGASPFAPDSMIGGAQSFMQAIRDMFIPPDATIITPIAIYREIG